MSPDLKKKVGLFIIILLIFAGLIAAWIYLERDHKVAGKSASSGTMTALKKFSGANPPFNFTFEYPEYWKAQEVVIPQGLNMAQIRGPQDERTKVIPGIFVTIRAAPAQVPADGLAEAILKREKRMKDFKEISKQDQLVGDSQALRLIFQYKLPLPMHSKDAKDTLVQRQEVYLLRQGKEYRMSSWMTEEQSRIYQTVFERFLESFKFLD